MKLDVGARTDVPNQGCGSGGALEFSYIWIANAEEGTVSKIDTQTMIEVGRYSTNGGSPSRTSVDLAGDVAVANRSGGVTKFLARSDECADLDGDGAIRTSTGAADVLPFGSDDCMAWHTPTPYGTQRPVAWTAGELDPDTCRRVGQKLWSSGASPSQQGSMVVQRFDGETGALEDLIPVTAAIVDQVGAYGGAVDSLDNFWFVTRDGGHLFRVDAETLEVDAWSYPSVSGYGITVDARDRPWISGLAGVARFDPVTEQWDEISMSGQGIQEDSEGMMWIAATANWGLGAQAIDRDSMAYGPFVELPGIGAKGVSVDYHGNIWVVDTVSTAYRIDRTTFEIDAYDGLYYPYTYSDMTGWALRNVQAPAG